MEKKNGFLILVFLTVPFLTIPSASAWNYDADIVIGTEFIFETVTESTTTADSTSYTRIVVTDIEDIGVAETNISIDIYESNTNGFWTTFDSSEINYNGSESADSMVQIVMNKAENFIVPVDYFVGTISEEVYAMISSTPDVSNITVKSLNNQMGIKIAYEMEILNTGMVMDMSVLYNSEGYRVLFIIDALQKQESGDVDVLETTKLLTVNGNNVAIPDIVEDATTTTTTTTTTNSTSSNEDDKGDGKFEISGYSSIGLVLCIGVSGLTLFKKKQKIE